MKKQITIFTHISLVLCCAILLLSSCEKSENETSESSKKETPKSKKGNWVEKDAAQFTKDVSKAMKAYNETLGKENTEAILECYLNKAIMEFESYKAAEANPEKCQQLAESCVQQIMRPEDRLKEIAEEEISEEKLHEVTNNLESLLNEELPKK
ncbi:MAG: hypothetical protein NXI10_06320 [bacterium]|nr:hypothetical protein [bacterium]